MADSKKHHFLPQFYLEFFKIEPQTTKYPHIFVIEKSARVRSYSAAIHDTGCLRDYHTIDTKERRDRNFVESILSKVESVQAVLLSRLISSCDVDTVNRKELSFLISLMYCRVPKFKTIVQRSMRKMVETMGEFMLRKGSLPPPPPSVAGTLKELGLTRFRDIVSVEIANWATLEQMFKCALSSRLWDLLSKMNMEVLSASGEADFVTGDTPVAVYGGALEHRDVEVSFPLGPRVMILLSWKTAAQGHRIISDRELREYNRRTVVMSDKYLYSRTDSQRTKELVAKFASESAGWKTNAFEYGEGALLNLNFTPVR